MVEFRQVVVATDGSRCAENAFEAALGLAVGLRAGLTILAVVEPAGAPAGPDDIPRLQAELAGRADEFRKRAEAAGLKNVRSAVEVGLPYSRILHYCETGRVDLLVVGAVGWRADASELGSVAEHVTRFARCPVLIVK